MFRTTTIMTAVCVIVSALHGPAEAQESEGLSPPSITLPAVTTTSELNITHEGLSDEQQRQLILHDLGRAQSIYDSVRRQTAESNIDTLDMEWQKLRQRILLPRKRSSSGPPSLPVAEAATASTEQPHQPDPAASKLQERKLNTDQADGRQSSTGVAPSESKRNHGLSREQSDGTESGRFHTKPELELEDLRSENARLKEELNLARNRIEMLETRLLSGDLHAR